MLSNIFNSQPPRAYYFISFLNTSEKALAADWNRVFDSTKYDKSEQKSMLHLNWTIINAIIPIYKGVLNHPTYLPSNILRNTVSSFI